MRRSVKITRSVSLAFVVLAVATMVAVALVWSPQNTELHPMFFMIGLSAFAVVLTAAMIDVRMGVGRDVTALYVLATLFSTGFLTGALMLLFASVFFAPLLTPIILVALVLTLMGRHYVAKGHPKSGTGLLLVPMALIVGVALDHPLTPGSLLWPTLLTIHLTLAAALIAALLVQVFRPGSARPDPA